MGTYHNLLDQYIGALGKRKQGQRKNYGGSRQRHYFRTTASATGTTITTGSTHGRSTHGAYISCITHWLIGHDLSTLAQLSNDHQACVKLSSWTSAGFSAAATTHPHKKQKKTPKTVKKKKKRATTQAKEIDTLRPTPPDKCIQIIDSTMIRAE